MDRPLRTLLCRASAMCCAVVAAAVLTGCASDEKKPAPKPQFSDMGRKVVPDFLRNSIFERVELTNTEPYAISSYGLIVNLDNTGDTTAPTAVREFMIKEMEKHGFGRKTLGWETTSPERMLRDKRVAIVQVVGMLPPGVRKGQSFDVYVSCLPGNQTTSLTGGKLFLTELRKDGANPRNPFGAVNVFGQAEGFIFVNPGYALNRELIPRGAALQSLRNGVILDGGMALFDRPLFLRLRQPQNSVARAIEQRLVERFQNISIAQAENEAIVQLYVPDKYRGDWEHLAKLATHVYMDNSPEFEAARAQQLVRAALKTDAPLEDISYCLEGIGARALPYLTPLLADSSLAPDVAFAMARAATCIGDPSGAGPAALMQIAMNSTHPFQLNAVGALSVLPGSGSVNHMLHSLLDTDNTLVRIAAYQLLVRNHDRQIMSSVVTERQNNQKFVLDIVPCRGKPLIFATRSGLPRIAIMGAMPEVATPVMFSAMENRLTISSTDVGNALTIYYRPPTPTDSQDRVDDAHAPAPVRLISETDVARVVERLGGVVFSDEHPLDFTYSEVLAILQRLSLDHKLVAWQDGQMSLASFVLQDPPQPVRDINANPAVDNSRPQGEAKAITPTGRAYEPAGTIAAGSR